MALLLTVVAIVAIRQAGAFLSPATPPLEKADLIVLLGGDAGARSRQGLELFRKGYAPRILLTALEEGEPEVQPSYLNWRARFLEKAGVPRARILVEARSQNTWDEAQYTLALMKQQGLRRVIVVSDPPHLRRLQWVWARTFKDSGIRFMLCPSHPSWWDSRKWWGNEVSLKFVVNEYIKIVYYVFKYS